MEFLRLHLPGLHQALRGALDSFSTFVSYLMGDAVPTVEREAQAAEELVVVATGRPGRTVEEEAQEALKDIRGSQRERAGGLRGPGEAGRHQGGSSVAEQTWAWEDGSSHGSETDRQDTGAASCQEPSTPLLAEKKSEAGAGACRDRSGQVQENQEPDEQEVNRGERLRTWEQEEEEEEEEVRAREPGMARGVESEWTWHREPEGKAGANGQKVAGDSREIEQVVKEAVVEETEGPGAKEAGKEEEVVVVVKGGLSTGEQGTQGPGAESEDWATSGREEAWITSGKEEVRTASGREDAGTTSDREDRKEVRTTLDREEAWTTPGREDVRTTSSRDEVSATLGRAEAWTTSGWEEVRTASGREETGTTLDSEDAWTTSCREEIRTASGREEAGTTSDREDREEVRTTFGREESWTISGREEVRTTSSREETWTASGREEADLSEDRETEYELVPGERTPEATGKVWAPEEEVVEKREAEVSLFPKQAQALGAEGVEEAIESQRAGREATRGQESEEESGGDFEGQADQNRKEPERKPDSEIRADGAGLEEVVQAEDVQEEKESCGTPEAELPPDIEAEGDADLEATPEARPEEEFTGKRSEEALRISDAPGVEWEGFEHKVTEGQESELVEGAQTPTKQSEKGQGGKEELWRVPVLSKEDTEWSLEEYRGHMGSEKPEVLEAFPEAWENWRRDVERGTTQEEDADAEEGEKVVAGSQALEAKAEAGQDSKLPEAPEASREEEKAKETGYGAEEGEASGAENQELDGSSGSEAGTGQSLAEVDVRETIDEEMEAASPLEADRTFSKGWRLDSKDTQTNSLAAGIVEDMVVLDERAAGIGEAWEGELERGWDSEGRQEAVVGENRGGQESGLEGSAEEEVVGRGGQAEAFEVREGEPGGGQVEPGESVGAEGNCGQDHLTLDFLAMRTEGTGVIQEAQGFLGEQILLEKESDEGQVREQRGDREGQHGDHHPEGGAPRPLDVADTLDVNDIKATGSQRAEAEETDPEGLGDVTGQEEQPTNQAEDTLGPRGDAETAEAAGSARGDARGSWSEALLPGSRLDVSVPRSRVLLSRSSSQRRSRPSFRRAPTPESLEDPSAPSLQPEEELPAPEQRLLQPEELPEPSPPRPEGTPVPARGRPLGYGFGFAHPGMMQELQARLGRPKPQ
ncbi:apolipoprotein B receptor [Carlito syrichta]|uniref:Apolipoprotein B receptor n=1 Tax=Carlito syrichta TaxID=1868482 RepID=A0A1U7STP2_CARSF|nr:apolipoprotein B receptor [Carlito syrichta]